MTEQVRDRMQSAFLGGLGASANASHAQNEVALREAKWKGADAHARKVVDEYYQSGKNRRLTYWILGGFVVGVLIVGLVTYLATGS